MTRGIFHRGDGYKHTRVKLPRLEITELRSQGRDKDPSTDLQDWITVPTCLLYEQVFLRQNREH